MRERVRRLVDSQTFNLTILSLIWLNVVVAGMETFPGFVTLTGGWVGRSLILIFVVEIALRLYAYPRMYVSWNVFDAVLTVGALMFGSSALSALRVLRMARMFRLLRTGRDETAPGLIAVIGTLIVAVYLSAVWATILFGEVAPRYFGQLGRSLWTQFQLLTGEDWSTVADAVMAQRSSAWLFFLTYIVLATLGLLNVMLAVVATGVESLRAYDRAEDSTSPNSWRACRRR